MAIPSILEETELYKRLKQLADTPGILSQERKERQKTITLINGISKEASELMKVTPTHFPEYTLHDETHLLSVTYLMGRILSVSGSFENLSYIEITILILAAYLHDIGMAPNREKVDKIIESSDFVLYRETRRRDLENLREIEVILEQPRLSDPERIKLRRKEIEIDQSILTEYLRQRHGEIGAEFIINKWSNDDGWVIEKNNLAESVSWVCKGHTLKHSQLVHEYSDKYPHEKHIGENKVNILYCTLILRLADILDFDRKRTPQVLYENISPQNDVSVVEWNKHMSVNGWEISHETILFECECTSSVYEKALREYLDYIDEELQQCSLIVKDFPGYNDTANKYKLQLPTTVTRTKIKAKNNAYTYMDLSFSLSHEEIMKLLMGNDFWGGTSLCIRELIQNAYDSIRHRKALEKVYENDWNQGKIILIQRLNPDGRLELECRDNGMGMDRHILKNYFFEVGRSYYRSPEFEKERAGLQGKKVDFDPISQFGIGIVSCFLIGNSLRIRTQRYLGCYKGCGEQLVIDVDGFSRMAEVRVMEGDPCPGTSITIIGQKMTQAEASDELHDPLFLLNTTRFYAAALDIPIEVIVEPPFKQCQFTVFPPPRPLKLKTHVEISSKIPSKYYVILQRDFSSMMNNCEGTVKVVFLTDADGKICTKNDLAYWEYDENRYRFNIKSSSGEKLNDDFSIRSVLSQDGIIIGSEDKIRHKLHLRSVTYRAPYHNFPGSYFINLYKSSKLPLKPSRAPYYPFISYFETKEERIWQKFERKLEGFIGGLLEDILENEMIRPESEDLWSIIEIYGFSLETVSKKCAYDFLPIPCLQKDSDKLEWKTLKDITAGGTHYIVLSSDRTLNSEFEEIISVPISGFNLELCKDFTLKDQIASLIRAVTVTMVKDGKVFYRVDLDTPKFEKLGESISRDYGFEYWTVPLSYQVYSSELNNYVSVNNLAMGMNFNHPVTQFLIKYFNEPIDEYKWFVYGMEILARDIANDVDFDEKNPSQWKDETKRLVNIIISHWEKVEWNKIPESISPPYNIFYPESGRSHPISLEYLRKKLKISGYNKKEDMDFLQGLD